MQPNDLTAAKCAELRAAGVNRISMGVQSMDNGLLAMLGRRHDAAEAVVALESCRQAGFDNVNLDLKYGLPHQSLEQCRTQWSGYLRNRRSTFPCIR